MIQLAIDHYSAGRFAQAEGVLRRVVAKNPRDAEALGLLGVMLSHQGQLPQALYFYERAIALAPDQPSVRVNYANTLWRLKRTDECIAEFQKAIELRETAHEAHIGLAAALSTRCDYEGAIRHARRSVEIAPTETAARLNLASTLGSAGLVAESNAVAAEGLQIDPSNENLIANRLMGLHYDPAMTPEMIAAEHRRLGERLAGLVHEERFTLRTTPDPERRLRVGYLSPDIRAHVVAVFLESLLRAHDRKNFEIIGVHVGVPDKVTERLLPMFDGFLQVHATTDRELLALLRKERIDILVDLAGHTEGSRSPMLTARAAPVQATYMGYPNTTGLPNVDYRIVDALTDPPGTGPASADALCTEKLVRLDRCFLCYTPPTDAPAVRGVPSATSGHVTFASFNAAPKINAELLGLWAEILRRVPGSRMIIKNRPLSSPMLAERIRAVFRAAGIAEDRIELIAWTATSAEHLATYGRVDIALDSLPYQGTTTTCEALYMGVPVVTMAGAAHVTRVGVSLLSAVGEPSLIAASREQYVDVAVALANDAARLRELRAGLRERVLKSPLCDETGLSRAIESAYRTMWRDFCTSHAAGATPVAGAVGSTR